MRLRPLFRWFGSKWSAARKCPPPLEGSTICEPFAGGAGYALNYADSPVQIWDTDPHLSVLWPWLIGPATQQDVLDIPLGVPEGTDIRTLGLSPGQAARLKTWQRTNNVGDCWTVSSWGSKPGFWTVNTRARVAEDIGAIKHWRFSPDVDDVSNRTWFIDPPYQYNYKYRAAPPDFSALGEIARGLAQAPRSRVIVCEGIGKNGERPDWLPFADSHLQVTSARTYARELIWVGGI